MMTDFSPGKSVTLPYPEEDLPPWSSDTFRAFLVPFDQTRVILRHRCRLQHFVGEWVLWESMEYEHSILYARNETRSTLRWNWPSWSAPAAAAACNVRFGCFARDSRKTLSWRFGRKGSVGHFAATRCSCCLAWLSVAMVVIAKGLWTPLRVGTQT